MSSRNFRFFRCQIFITTIDIGPLFYASYNFELCDLFIKASELLVKYGNYVNELMSKAPIIFQSISLQF